MEPPLDWSKERLSAMQAKVEAEYPGCGVVIVVTSGHEHHMTSSVPRPILADYLEHIVKHLRGTCEQCK